LNNYFIESVPAAFRTFGCVLAEIH